MTIEITIAVAKGKVILVSELSRELEVRAIVNQVCGVDAFISLFHNT